MDPRRSVVPAAEGWPADRRAQKRAVGPRRAGRRALRRLVAALALLRQFSPAGSVVPGRDRSTAPQPAPRPSRALSRQGSALLSGRRGFRSSSERARDQRRHWLPLAEAERAPLHPVFRADRDARGWRRDDAPRERSRGGETARLDWRGSLGAAL